MLLCDEPTGALDISTGIVVLEALAQVNAELGTTTVVITHNAAIAQMADRVIRLADGRVIAGRGANRRKLAPARAVMVTLMRISALNRKLLRDLVAMKGQALAIAMVVAAGVSMFVMYLSNFASLQAHASGVLRAPALCRRVRVAEAGAATRWPARSPTCPACRRSKRASWPTSRSTCRSSTSPRPAA